MRENVIKSISLAHSLPLPPRALAQGADEMIIIIFKLACRRTHTRTTHAHTCVPVPIYARLEIVVTYMPGVEIIIRRCGDGGFGTGSESDCAHASHIEHGFITDLCVCVCVRAVHLFYRSVCTYVVLCRLRGCGISRSPAQSPPSKCYYRNQCK